SSIENLDSGPDSPRILRASCNAACHCLASTQYLSEATAPSIDETSTNQRILTWRTRIEPNLRPRLARCRALGTKPGPVVERLHRVPARPIGAQVFHGFSNVRRDHFTE